MFHAFMCFAACGAQTDVVLSGGASLALSEANMDALQACPSLRGISSGFGLVFDCHPMRCPAGHAEVEREGMLLVVTLAACTHVQL